MGWTRQTAPLEAVLLLVLLGRNHSIPKDMFYCHPVNDT